MLYCEAGGYGKVMGKKKIDPVYSDLATKRGIYRYSKFQPRCDQNGLNGGILPRPYREHLFGSATKKTTNKIFSFV